MLTALTSYTSSFVLQDCMLNIFEKIDSNIVTACNNSVTENYIAMMHRFLTEHQGSSKLFGCAMCPSCSIIQVNIKDPIEDSVVTVVTKKSMRKNCDKEYPEKLLEAASKCHKIFKDNLEKKHLDGRKN